MLHLVLSHLELYRVRVRPYSLWSTVKSVIIVKYASSVRAHAPLPRSPPPLRTTTPLQARVELAPGVLALRKAWRASSS